jgi:hypothetical protein
MHKLIAVEEARRILTTGKEWSIWRWLLEKRKVRTAADAGTAALDDLEKKVKAGWSPELKKAYRELPAEAAVNGNGRARRQHEKAREEAGDPALRLAARKVKEADDIAYKVRMDAEALFAEAERRLSGSLAREAAEKALQAYDLREKAIRRAEAACRVTLQES